MTQTHKRYLLPVIVLSQFAGTSLWFVGNAVLPELKQSLGLNQYAVSQVTSAVMLGFVAGTLVFAFFSLADRISPVKLFFVSSLLGALTNSAVAWIADDAASLYALRFLTGFFIAGIYPVGMKIASDWYEKGLGKALGFLLGALVLGTAFPHLLKSRSFHLPWRSVMYYTSVFALTGGVLMLFFVGDGPFKKKSGRFQWNSFAEIFRSKKWRQAAFGYFGHMWELYTFWGFVPIILELYSSRNGLQMNIPLISFLIITSGCMSCILGGYLSQRFDSARVAAGALIISGVCCLLSPVFFYMPFTIFLLFLFIWGLAVIPDSPQFSTLVSKYAPEHLRGTALTIYNSIGFSISIISLFVIDHIYHSSSIFGEKNSFALLGLGALAGLPSMIRLINLNNEA
ncbi:MAG: MFS transporter [Chitinophagaceae bacterium]|nr:MFS transporter [Chitinophagaceae bacterium]